MNPKTDCRPIKLRKYQERLDTHCTSRSQVMTPDCSMDLKRMVRGKGNFTVEPVSVSLAQWDQLVPTDHEAREEGIDPAHDQCLRNHHHHISLQHTHHSFHARRVSHGIRRRLATVVGIFQKCTATEACDHIVLADLEGLAVKHRTSIVSEVHTSEKGKALARFGKSSWRLWCRVHQDRRIVAENSGQDL